MKPESIVKLNALLQLERKIAGVKFIKSEEEYDHTDAIQVERSMNYCLMVASASRGHVVKAREKNIKCQSGVRTLGINPADPKNSNGENWAKLGLYDSRELSKKIRKDLTYVTEPSYGIAVGDAQKMGTDPDVFIIITNPYNCMRLLQGYAYHYGMPGNINMLGNQAICLECTARPYVTQDINVSMLCIGTRHRTRWSENELAIGIPAKQFDDIVDGVYRTANIMESNENKQRIQENFDKLDGMSIELQPDYNYYMDC